MHLPRAVYKQDDAAGAEAGHHRLHIARSSVIYIERNRLNCI